VTKPALLAEVWPDRLLDYRQADDDVSRLVFVEFDASTEKPVEPMAFASVVIQPMMIFRFDRLVVPPGVARHFQGRIATRIIPGAQVRAKDYDAMKSSIPAPEDTGFLSAGIFDGDDWKVLPRVSGFPQRDFSAINPLQELVITVRNCGKRPYRFFGYLAGRGVQ